MQTANCIIKTSDVHTIPVYGVTPAEAQVLVKIHFKGANGQALESAALATDVERDGQAEYERLCAKYNPSIIAEMWPGHNKRLPQTFDEAGIKLTNAPQPVVVPTPADLPAEDVAPEVEPLPEKKPVVKKSKLA